VSEALRKLGRPPLVEGERAETISGSLPLGLYDQATKLAHAKYDGNLSVVVRLAIMRFVRDFPIDK
jgi:hypothetical protein